jgi:hypothetical protein
MIDNLVPAYRFLLVIPGRSGRLVWKERFWFQKGTRSGRCTKPSAFNDLLVSSTYDARAVIGQTIARCRALEKLGGSGHRNADALEAAHGKGIVHRQQSSSP